MQSIQVVVAHSDRAAAEQISNDLSAYFRRVCVAKSAQEVPDAIARNHAQLAVLDLEMVTAEDVKEIAKQFTGTAVVCVHRVPDEEKWMTAVSAGAVDCCHPTDLKAILNALRLRTTPKRMSAAA